jgi:predicted permease
MSNFTKQQFLNSLSGLAIPFISILLSYFIAIAAAKILRVDSSRRGLFISMFFSSNTIFMGLPINEAIYGQKSLPYVLLYYIANTTFVWTIGVYEISKDGTNGKVKLFSKDSLKNLISPPLMGYIVAVILIVLGINLPTWLMDSCKYLGNLTTPLSMIFIGITIYSVSLKEFRLNKDIIGVLLGRFIACPLIIIALLLFSHTTGLMKDVFVVQAAMPVMTNSAIISKMYNSDYKFAAVVISITTIASLAVIPIYASLIH